jgi:hypothetical protein
MGKGRENQRILKFLMKAANVSDGSQYFPKAWLVNKIEPSDMCNHVILQIYSA